ncbi:MAG: hypothetical protein AAF483_13270 [Planctomycetota bacterium]
MSTVVTELSPEFYLTQEVNHRSDECAVDSVHQRFNDNQLRMLSPILGLVSAPGPQELEHLIETHPMATCRPGGCAFYVLIDLVERFCELRSAEWKELVKYLPSHEGR